jgi:hypothetical protein
MYADKYFVVYVCVCNGFRARCFWRGEILLIDGSFVALAIMSSRYRRLMLDAFKRPSSHKKIVSFIGHYGFIGLQHRIRVQHPQKKKDEHLHSLT